MHEVTVRTELRVRPDHVFDFLLDNRNDPLWCPLASDVDLTEGEPGEGAVYRFAQATFPGGPTSSLWLRTTVADRPHRLEWDNAGRGLPYRATIELDERDGRTRIIHTNRVTLPSRLQQAVWFTGAHAVLRAQLRNLRRELER